MPRGVALGARPGLDWSARDRKGRTILGIAVHAATEMGGTDANTEIVRLLVAAGARYQDDAITENGRLFSSVVYNSGDQYVALMDHLLTAGANPDDTEEYDDRPLLIHHNMTVAKARVLLAHGANLQGIRDTRSDRAEWDALMNAAYMRNWPLASLYLAQGNDPTYKAKNGKTVRQVIADVIEEERGIGSDRFGDGYDAFVNELKARLKSQKGK